jgi:hypothetical protein
MPRRPGRPPPVGLLVLASFLASGCAAGAGSPDSGSPDSADAPPASGNDAPALAHHDARIGLAGGSPCEAGAQCLSGACTLGTCSDWAHAARITIDTTVAGAGIEQAVTDFPLLLRLDDASFPFVEARGDGADVRFVDASGQNLAHEIERWDAANALADLWVLVPRIDGDRRDNAIYMYWGNPLAAPLASGPAVFGSFACVLHMDDDVDGIATRLADASGQGNAGLLQSPLASPLPAPGLAGPGLGLDGNGAYLATSARSMSPQTFTVSLWLRTTSSARAGISAFASRQLGSDVRFDRAIGMDEAGRLTFGVSHGSELAQVASVTSYNDGAWHMVVARLSANGEYLFVDGESVADAPSVGSADNYSGYWRFGQEPIASPPPDVDAAVPAGNYFVGALDEIRVSARETSDAGIKLAYATQRPGANAVVFARLP